MKNILVSGICVVTLLVVALIVQVNRLVEFGSIGPTQVETKVEVEIVPYHDSGSIHSEGDSKHFFDTKMTPEEEALAREYFQKEFSRIKSEVSLDSAEEVGEGNIKQMMLEVFGSGDNEKTSAKENGVDHIPTQCSVSFVSQPVGAKVYINGNFLQEGATLVMHNYPVGAKLVCRFVKDGYKSLERNIVVPKKSYHMYRVELMPEVSPTE